MKRTACVFVCVLLVSALSAVAKSPDPQSHFGFKPGSDRQLFDYEELIAYLDDLAGSSDRLELRKVGASPEGRPMYLLFISAPDNIRRLDELRAINRSLAIDADLNDTEREDLVSRGKVFVMATLSMHSSEVAPTQALPLYAYELATSDDSDILAQLDSVVLMIVPNHNPDGMNRVVEHYRTYRGTPYETSSLPGVYHRYVGHDNNRDFVTLTQDDTQVINRIFSREWYPQVLVEKHQMGSTGPRYFVPENHDPIAENVDESLWSWSAVFGANLQQDMGRDGLDGVASNWLFDDYWPGSTETSLWKNVISFLTEAASCRTATPVYVEKNELSVRGKGLSEYKKSVNMPSPWMGGWWRLSDIVEYELSSMRSILATAAAHDEEILRSRNRLAVEEVERGRSEAPFYYVLPPVQHDRGALPRLVELLQEHGVECFQLAERVEIQGAVFEQGSVVVPLAQPYRAFIKEVMEDQRYPVRHYTPGGEVIRPYDITSWSLPRHRGLECHEIEIRSSALETALEKIQDEAQIGESGSTHLDDEFAALAWPAADNDSYEVAFKALREGLEVRRTTVGYSDEAVDLGVGSFIIEGSLKKLRTLAREAELSPVVFADLPPLQSFALRLPKIALIESYFHDMDAGWTRFVLDQAGIPFTVLRPGDVEDAPLEDYDVVIVPDQSSDVLRKGRRESRGRYRQPAYPPEYQKAISKKGMAKIVAWIDNGGIIVSWGRSTELFTGKLELGDGDDENAEASFQLPIRDQAEDLEKKGLLVPGTFLAVDVRTDHPVAWGMPPSSGVFSRGAPVFGTSLPIFDMDRRVVAAYAEHDSLISGYAENEELLEGKSVLVWLRKNKGQLVLMGFSPQFRASTPATFKFLFNALLLPPVDTSEQIFGLHPEE